MELKAIRNISKIDQWTVWGGKKHNVPPFATVMIREEIADKILKERAPLVIAVEGFSDVDDVTWMGDSKWIYNCTGNPDLPDTVKTIVWKNKSRQEVDIQHPLKVPRIVSRDYNLGQAAGKLAGRDAWIPLGQSTKEIPPYRRKRFSSSVADWMLHRDALTDFPGAIRECPSPGEFEPDNTWDYEDVYHYSTMIDQTMDEVLSTKKIEIAHKKGDFGDVVLEDAIDQEKHELLKRIFFRLCDKQYTRPSRDEFDTLVKDFKKNEKKDDKSPAKKGAYKNPSAFLNS